MNTAFDPLFQPYASNRYCVTARNGMVCTGSNLASAAGLEVLRKGHQISIAPDGIAFGRGQMIVRLENGVLVGGCESRTDSNIACY